MVGSSHTSRCRQLIERRYPKKMSSVNVNVESLTKVPVQERSQFSEQTSSLPIVHSHSNVKMKYKCKEKITRGQLAHRETEGLHRNVLIINGSVLPIKHRQSSQCSFILGSSIGLRRHRKIDQSSSDSKDTINNSNKHLKRNQTIKCPTKIKCLIVLLIVIAILSVILIPSLVILLNRKPDLTTTTRAPPAAILRWNLTGTTVAGVSQVANNTPLHLNLPWDLAVDWTNTLYVSDRLNNRVQKFIRGSLNGTTVAGRSDGLDGKNMTEFNETNSVIIDWAENLYISDRNNDRVQCWYRETTTGETIAGISNSGGNTLNKLNGPAGMFRDHSTGFLYVTDQNNDRIMAYRYGNITGDIAAGGNGNGSNPNQLNNPIGLHYDSITNSLYIANTAANNIVRWTIGESQWTIVLGDPNGTQGSSPSLLKRPSDVALDPIGNIYIADRNNQRIQFLAVGATNVTTIAGKSNQAGAFALQLWQPNAIALDGQLNLYVADSRNHRIQKFNRY